MNDEVDWKQSLPEDLRGSEGLTSIPDVATLAKSYLDAQSFIGRSVRIPTDEASDEERDKFYQRLISVAGVARIPDEDDAEGMSALYAKLGRPEAAKDYGLEGDFAGEFVNVAHANGLSTRQAAAINDWFGAQAEATEQAINAQREASEAFLKKEWGNAYEQKLKLASAAAMTYGGQEFVEALGVLGNAPAVLKALAKIGEGLEEGQIVQAGGRGGFKLSPAEAQEKINDILRNKDHDYHQPRSAGHDAAMDKMRELFQQAYPD